MKRLLLPMLTCGLLVACGGGIEPAANTFTLSGTVLLPAGSIGAASLSIPSPADWSRRHVVGEVLVVGANGQALPGALGSLSLQSTGDAAIRRVQTPPGESDETFAAQLNRELGVQGVGQGVWVQPNYLYRALSVPNDPGYPTNAGVMVGTALYDQDYLTRINALAGWDAVQAQGNTAVSGAIMAILDTGIDRNHPELQDRLLPGHDFCATADANDNCLTESSDPSDSSSGGAHATAIAGIAAAAGNNGKGLVGLTWSGRNILPVKVFDNAGNVSTVALAKGIGYSVSQGARVINMSLGAPGLSDAAVNTSLKAAADAGVVLVAAAGNTSGDGLYYPASDPNVLAIGSIGGTDPKSSSFNDLACYSARPISGQKELDLVAPGGNAGTGTSNCFQSSSYDTLVLAPGGGYTLSAGTSEAAPMVSGTAALMFSVRPDLKASQVRSLLKSSARTVTGGKLLDVGAAVKAALAATQNAPRAYTLTVQAGGVSTTSSGTLPIGSNGVPYSLGGVPAGQTTLSASLTVDGKNYTGSLPVTVDGNQPSLNIQTQ
ncbi:S8 family serine peptidase (plasmid) [Deinococcus radiomollis]|uniref:S8 family serine peptidase n=1 Tax=Deinococcus radiomollis TaxID=468916 RepID=UPI003892C1D1